MQKLVLRLFMLIGIVLLPVAFKKKTVKDWIIVFLLTALISAIVDHVLVQKKFLTYPVRIFPNSFKYHLVFDLLLCPLVSVFYNQFTYKDKSILRILRKQLCFTIPQLLIEVLAGKYLNMVRWHKGWKWYHTFINMNIKYLTIRALMGFIRRVSKKQATEFNRHDYLEEKSSF
ncbi:CBO0543 family protein [Niallia sp. Krafla_26]|uniref:CBO0543 family protein n=1 Tax=Niallia sp. Krafla_26 TaxID=3064703 RepID=UPI003D175429